MTTLDYIAKRFKVNINQRKQPLDLPNATRETLAELFAELNFVKGAEIGVEKGIYSEILLQKNPKLELFAIDAWTAYKGYRDHVTQEECDNLLAEATKRLSIYNANIIKGFSTDVAKDFEDNSLDFVYIDGNHEYSHVVADISAWEKKVKVGGIVSGHDYIKRKGGEYYMHVIPAVSGFVESYRIKPLMVLGRKELANNLDPKKGELRESPRSWLYVKPEPPVVVRGHNQPY